MGTDPRVYSVIYRVLKKQKLVEGLHVRHGARWRFKPSEVT